jgi:hypothetical protein
LALGRAGRDAGVRDQPGQYAAHVGTVLGGLVPHVPGVRLAGFAASGRHVPTIDLGTPDYQGSRHYGSHVARTERIVRWFGQLVG